MPRISKITPNLVVSDVERSLAFYRDLLGFSVA
jgi:catechol 2,3-dioxygenase-like lactoylglutathione lyase family enzyme